MTEDTRFELRLAVDADRGWLTECYAAYRTELAAYHSDFHESSPLQSDWFEKPEQLFTYIIERAGRPIGFLLGHDRAYAEALGFDADFSVYALYVVPPERGSGAAQFAALADIQRRPGVWSIDVLERNTRALAFWRSLLSTYNATLVESAGGEAGYRRFRFSV